MLKLCLLIATSLFFAIADSSFILTPTYAADSGPFKSIRQVVYKIHVLSETGMLLGGGSGVLIDNERVLTANHVVNAIPEKGRLVVVDEQYGERTLEISILKQDEMSDLALLEVKQLYCPCAPLARSAPKPDVKVYSVGFPMNQFVGIQIVTEGTYQGMHVNKYIVTSPIAPGNSGGGTFIKAKSGTFYLIGIVTDTIAMSYGFGSVIFFTHLAMAAPLNVIKEFLKNG